MTPEQDERVLEEFDGYVDSFEGDTGYVRFKSRLNGDVFYGRYPAAKFLENGIEEQSRFILRTIAKDEWMRIDLEAVPDVEITPEEALRIKAKIEEAFPGKSLDVLY